MKKTLVTALTTALVVGAASTTFAAANPFSDVPMDHWAYDAVAQLAEDGVIEGYGDGTFRGDRNITRYEMAQLVAKAMANDSASMSDRALIDRLAAEFADELNNLGVRVANLERNADMVKWNGKLEYTYFRDRTKDNGVKEPADTENNLKFRLEPRAEVNKNWSVNARLDAGVDLKNDTSDTVKLKRAWAQGDYNNFQVKLGKFASYNDDNIFDANFSGGEVRFGDKFDVILGAGRLNRDSSDALKSVLSDNANYQYAGLEYEADSLMLGASYHRLEGNIGVSDEKANVWMGKASYMFNDSVGLNGLYARSNVKDVKSAAKKAYHVELTYKGAEQEDAGSWGAWVAYRHMGDAVAVAPTYDVLGYGLKGWEIGANYAPFENVVTTLRYADGKEVSNTDRKHKQIFGQVEFLF